MEREREMFEERKHCTLCVHCRVVIWQAYIHTWLASIMGIVSSSLRARLQNFQSHALMGKLLSALAKLLPFPTKTLESLKNHLIRQELRRRQQPQRLPLSWLDPGMLSLTKTAITGQCVTAKLKDLFKSDCHLVDSQYYIRQDKLHGIGRLYAM